MHNTCIISADNFSPVCIISAEVLSSPHRLSPAQVSYSYLIPTSTSSLRMSSTSSRPLGYLLQVTHVGPKFNKHAVRIVGRERGGKTFPHIFPYYFLLLPLSFSSIYDGIIVFKILFPAWLYILYKRRLFSISFFADSLIFSPACFYQYTTYISATCCCLSTRFSNKRRYTCFQFVV